jgi:hypothetical protein
MHVLGRVNGGASFFRASPTAPAGMAGTSPAMTAPKSLSREQSEAGEGWGGGDRPRLTMRAHSRSRIIGAKPLEANSNAANSNPGATVQPTSVQSPQLSALCQ